MLEWLDISTRADVAVARQQARAEARLAGLPPDRIESVAIVATELVTNIVKYAGSGRFLAQTMDLPRGPRLALIASDAGPGIPDIDRMRRDLVSSAASAGIGLGAIERLSDRAEIMTSPETGTLWACAFEGPGREADETLDVAALRLCHPTESVCGDDWRAVEARSGLRLVLADGMGHGEQAAEAGTAMAEGAVRPALLPPKHQLARLGEDLRRTRGGVISILDFDTDAERCDYANLGNISGFRLRDGEQTRFAMRDGYIGSPAARPMGESFDMKRGDFFILHSDGLRTIGAELLPMVQGRSCLLAAAFLLSRTELSRRDDISVAVARWRPTD
ncbi:ATP-binding protein [Allosediminivita pacifica]|uniref:Anti-sigma regulatory factor (Ser/Thr protein kinase) n=1 Tax=Allosediminivita pacifica TaxID=1267769 RepID=A0A2T6APV2_9RHOB|nr:ATP-binding protein [Allosediminivita pacifica]PTX45854.1 anti-sigma regulatory factor (Ser/Thr protein kinase) [Allosediminivita pacifica]GGB19653.1 hypothetical protein GCM10011324_32200 [Allosediminivita pacifica]